MDKTAGFQVSLQLSLIHISLLLGIARKSPLSIGMGNSHTDSAGLYLRSKASRSPNLEAGLFWECHFPCLFNYSLIGNV